ncbi:hypothetical protein IT397_02840 [Candidatus Nomurabacteria bacterium]|nr:hypothetical protein [Candidatus Nomurabacteria bacterium]
MEQKISWQDFEHRHSEKGNDWYWAVGIISTSIIIMSVILKNYLFAVLVFFAIISAFIQANKKPRLFNFEINKKGVVVGNTLYPYDNLEGFCIPEEEDGKILLIKSKKMIVPLIMIPISNVNHEQIKNFLSEKIVEEELHESFFQKVAEYFGF